MKKLILFLLLFIWMTGCGGEDLVKDEDTETAQSKEMKKDMDEKTEEASEAENVDDEDGAGKNDLGEMKVELSGKASIKEESVTIDGESNLLPGTFIYSSGVTDSGFASSNFISKAEVQQDGSFTFEFDGISKSTTVKLKLYNTKDETKKHYGENLEKITGPQKYKTENHGEFEVKTEFYINTDLPMPYTIPIEIPEWEEKPDDYGDPGVWMKAEVDSDHRYLYFHGESNLVEGTQVGGNLRKASGIIDAFSFGHTRVNPDGTFELRVPYHQLKQGMYMPIQVEPDRNSWDNFVSAYGEQGEKWKGNLVKNDKDVNYLEYIVEIDAPDFDPAEDVGLTVDEEEIKMQMPDHLLFDFDKSELKEEAKKTLDKVIQDLQELEEGTNIQINGHTDNVGDADYNQELSKERADAVWIYLKKNGKLDGLRVEKQGYGDTQPIASNKDEDGQKKNRRVEIVINPKETDS
ncbi:OmpA family protein [Virgibacillus sp. SK37]|uniref:OmpA family protein n=1 Tax=Virgibacillus sp. SK37 TaxID=403957 RepID=UPI0018DE2AD2|nr:OmpA family protein [Virgibacillus sp. SK37]